MRLFFMHENLRDAGCGARAGPQIFAECRRTRLGVECSLRRKALPHEVVDAGQGVNRWGRCYARGVSCLVEYETGAKGRRIRAGPRVPPGL